MANLQHTPTSKPKNNLSLLINKIRSNMGSSQSLGGFLKSAFFYLYKKNLPYLAVTFIRTIARHLYVLIENKRIIIVNGNDLTLVHSRNPYAYWLSKNSLKPSGIQSLQLEQNLFSFHPTAIVILRADSANEKTHQSIDSILNQVYTHWKLYIVCDSKDLLTDLKTTLENKGLTNPQKIYFDTLVPMQFEGVDVSKALILQLFSGDQLSQDALFYFAKYALIHPAAAVLYSDEDEINEYGVFQNPCFKPDWSPDSLLSYDYIQSAVVFRLQTLSLIPNWQQKLQANLLFDLLLQATEQTAQVVHIPRMLYHAVKRTVSPTLLKSALSDAMMRRMEGGFIEESSLAENVFIPRYPIQSNAKISIIIPTKDKVDILKVCINSIVQLSTFSNYEIILIDNNSSTPAFFNQVKKWEQEIGDRFKCFRTERPFNFAYLMNFGASHCSGNYFVLLNNDTEIITPNWLELLLEQAQRDSIGIAGAKLLYPNNTVQHAGVVVGLSGLVDHVFVGTPRHGQTYQNYLHRVINYSALTAACFMVSKDKFYRVDGFNENFEVEYNDVDFCLRLKEAGFNHVYLPHVELYHHESISRGHPFSNKASYERHLREFTLMQTTWKNYVYNDPCYNPNLSLKNRNMMVDY